KSTDTGQRKIRKKCYGQTHLSLRSEDLISRSKRQNIRMIGLPEDSETAFSNIPELDRAHRSLGQKPRTGGRWRSIIVRFHRYKEKERVLRWSREHSDITFQGHKIKFNQDFSSSLAKKWSAFNNTKSTLYKKGIRFGLIYPARLRVTFNGEVNFFKIPKKLSPSNDSAYIECLKYIECLNNTYIYGRLSIHFS
uniref:Uncharacterized protein n=1 Tax=Hucho hucho TaxID=62062 RepID=A0A4W5KR00_9TELE